MQDNRTFINTANNYLEWFSRNYGILKGKYNKFCKENGYKWDEDVFSNTYLKIYEKIRRSGLKDPTPKGFDNYTFLSFKQNTKRESQYAREQKRDLNYSSEKISSAYEDWYNANKEDSRTKLVSDLYKDFATLYIMTVVEENFENDYFYLFKLKQLCGYTYKQLSEKTGIRGARQKVLDVKNWLKTNLTKDELNKAFISMYGDLL